MEEIKKYGEIIKAYALKNNLIYSIGRARPFPELKPILEAAETPFISQSPEERTNPYICLPNAKSVICLGLSYNKKSADPVDNELRGNISAGAVGEDYHITLSRHLKLICRLLKTDEIYFTDTGPLVDRAVAELSCLGKRGKHLSVINPKIGSMFFIGYILTALELEPTEGYDSFNPCKSCDKCIKACPGGAISDKGFNYKRCISYLTQAKELTKEDYSLMGRQLYGCDICQRVCPYNKEPEPIYGAVEDFHPKLRDILSMTNKEFAARFKPTAAGWRGKKLMQRNAVIALSNIRDKRAAELLAEYADDSREDIRSLIQWAAEKHKNGG